MPRPKPAEETVQIAVRLSPALLAELDAERALSGKSRNGEIAYALMRYVDDRKQSRLPKPKNTLDRPPEERERAARYFRGEDATPSRDGALDGLNVQFGPTKTTPGSRLKPNKGLKP